MANQTSIPTTERTRRMTRSPASWRRFATRPRNPVTGVSLYGPWSSLKPYALKLLKHEHRILRRMLKELDKATTGSERARRLARVESEYVAYSRVCLEVFYPAYQAACKTAAQRKVYHELVEQHRACELHLADLQRAAPESAQSAGRAKALRLALNEIFHEEQHTLFHQARRLMGRANLKALGRSMQDHRRALVRNPSLAPMSTVRAT